MTEQSGRLLPDRFVKDYSATHRQIQASDVGVAHRDIKTAIRQTGEDIWGQALGFLAEYQKISWFEDAFGIAVRYFFA